MFAIFLGPVRCTLLLVVFAAAAHGQTATLLGDLNTTFDDTLPPRHGSSPRRFAVLGDRMVFAAEEPGSGSELWVTDGTPAGTRILEDICPGECSSDPWNAGVTNGVSLWLAKPFEAPWQLWRSDGTEAGTYAVDVPFRFHDPEFRPPLLMNGVLYFGECMSDQPGCPLWLSDGTVEGTRPVKALLPSPTLLHSGIGPLVAAGNRFFFTLGTHPTTLWVSDGTAAGTRSLVELGPGFVGPPLLMAGTPDGRLFFAPWHDPAGRELWVSDGTPSGTRRLTRFANRDPFHGTEWMKPLGNRVYLLLDDGVHGQEIWRSDGTEGGTRRVTGFAYFEPFGNGLRADEIEEAGGRVLFRATDGLGPDRVWVSGGSPGSTAPLGGLHLTCASEKRFLRAGSRAFFVADDGVHGCQVWSTDGTAAGTRIATDLSSPSLLEIHQGSVLFLAGDAEAGQEIWSSDGTAAGTYRITDMPGSARPGGDSAGERAWNGDRLFFTGTDGHGEELWIADGGGTRLVADIERQEPGSRARDLAPFGDRLVFTACDGAERRLRISSGTPESTVALSAPGPLPCAEFPADQSALGPVQAAGRVFFAWQDQLWSTDGTAAGAVRLTDLPFPGLQEFRAAVLQGKVYFPVSAGGSTRVWTSDGTSQGTVPAFDLPEVSFIHGLTAVGDELWFTGYDDGSGHGVWRSDGAPAGTRRLLTGHMPMEEPWFTRAGSSVFFFAQPDPSTGELWKTDGTAEGTVRVAGPFNEPRELIVHQGKLYFFGDAPHLTRSLWRSDGTEAGTVLLRSFEIQYVNDGPTASQLVSFGGRLYFVADGADGLGSELWTSDGTAEGTAILRDVQPGAGSSRPSGLVAAGGRLFFAADDGEHGAELWMSDGTAEGTRLAQDLAPEDLSSHPGQLTATPTHLYFVADDGLSGREPWSLPLAGGGCQPSPRRLCLGGRYQVEAAWKDFQGNTGAGTAAPITADTGYFWFFSPANVEVIVKMLDGTGLNGHRWVFYGALSSVEYTLTVTDTQTGLTRRYFNPPGQLASVGDTTGFGPLGAFSTVAAGICHPTAERLCLNNQRFAVEIAWKDFQGHQGKGRAVNLTPDTGWFWFFDAANVEVVLKVLDGTGLNGKHWVFYGALSSVEYTITVTDTQTGAQKTYENPSGRLASVADVGAF